MRYWCYNLKRGLPNFIRNVWVQRKALWGASWYDYSGLLMYMQGQLKYMECRQRVDSYSLNSDRYCDQMKVCIIILERLIQDDYSVERWNFVEDENAICGLRMEPKYSFPVGRKRIGVLGLKQRQIDKEVLFNIMAKYVDHWWD